MMIVRKSVGLIKKLERFISIVGWHLYEKNVNLNHTEVENAIAEKINNTDIKWDNKKPYKNTVTIDGQIIEFHAKKLENGKINIGTYFIKGIKDE